MGLDLCEHGEGAYHISQRSALQGRILGTLEVAASTAGGSELHHPSIEGTRRRRGGGGGGSAPRSVPSQLQSTGSHGPGFADLSLQPSPWADHGGSGNVSGSGSGAGDAPSQAVATIALQTFNPPATSPAGGLPVRPEIIAPPAVDRCGSSSGFN